MRTTSQKQPKPDESFSEPDKISSFGTYAAYCLELFRMNLTMYSYVAGIKADLDMINAYENIATLESPKKICILDQNSLTGKDLKRAEASVLEGRFFTEHTAAGEATRLGLGAKYLVNIAVDLSLETVAGLVSRVSKEKVAPRDVHLKAGCSPEDLLPLSLGSRHMFQLSYDIAGLAEKRGYDPKKVLGQQHLLMVLNDATAETIITEFRENKFFGFKRQNVFFMIQKSHFGINVVKGHLYYDGNSKERLHNHGQMVMQQTADHEIFRVDKDGSPGTLTSAQFGRILNKMDDKVSCNIEDLGFLTGAIDIPVLALALIKSDQGYSMLMEIMANDPENPQKGGMAAYDPVLGRNVMIEGFQLNGIKNSAIRYLNRNVNHYPKPHNAWRKLKEEGLNIPVVVKGKHLYGQAV